MKLENVQSRKQEAVKPAPRRSCTFSIILKTLTQHKARPLCRKVSRLLLVQNVSNNGIDVGWKLGISHYPFCQLQPNKCGLIPHIPRVPGPVGARRRHRHRRRILVLLHNVAFAAHPGSSVGQLERKMPCMFEIEIM